MARSTGTALSLLRAALLCGSALFLLDATSASARVGVTSATDGDPLGKPPQENERILRIGIDVQANEVITTGTTDRAHLVFLDGTSLTVGPNAQLTIDKFVYDPNSKTGELAVNATKGVFRLVGGKISKTNDITVTTPSSTIGIRGGICVFSVGQNQTSSTFLFGNHMRVNANGQTQNVTRPGSQVTTNAGSAPGAPTLVGQGGLAGQMNQLEGNNSGGNSGGGSGGSGGSGQGGGTQQSADNGARNFSQTPGQGQGSGGPTPQGGPNPNNGGGRTPGQDPNNRPPVADAKPQNQPKSATTSSTTTTRIITQGRFLKDPTYSGFNAGTAFASNDLSVTRSSTNDQTITSPSDQNTTTTTTTTSSSTTTTTSNTITLKVPGLDSVTLDWKTGTIDTGYSLGNKSVLGTNVQSGTGYVSSSGDFFAFIFTTPGNKKLGIFGGTPTTTSGTSGFPTSGQVSFTVASLGDSGGRLPFADDTAGSDSSLTATNSNGTLKNGTIGKLYSAYSSTLGVTTAGTAMDDKRATAMQSTVSIAGSGSSQKSYMGVFIGQYLRDMNMTGGAISNDRGVALTGEFNGTYRLGGSENVGRLTSSLSTPLVGTTGHAIYGTSTTSSAASGMVLTPDKLSVTIDNFSNPQNVTSTNTAQASYNQTYKQSSSSDYYSVTGAYNRTEISGNTRTDHTMNGFVGGLVEQANSSGNLTGSSGRIIGNADATDMVVTTSPTNNRISADVTLSKWDSTSTGGSANVKAEFKLGSTTGSNDASSAFIDDNRYAMADSNTTARTTAFTKDAGTSPTTVGATSNTVMVSYNSASVDSLFTSANNGGLAVSKCECSFLTWGWWGGDVAYSSGGAYNAGGRDRINLATYVSGVLATTTQLPQVGSATFTGHLVGNVQAGSNNYIAVGSYNSSFTWGGGGGSGSYNVTFDGATYGTANYTVAGSSTVANTVQFSGSSTASVGGTTRTLNLNGAFFQAGNAVAGQAGNFGVTSTGTGNNAYQAAGTFAAKKN